MQPISRNRNILSYFLISFTQFNSLAATADKITKYSRLLVRHQNVLSKLRAEIRSTVGIGPDAPLPTMKDVKKMPYLAIVLKEGMIPSSPSTPLPLLSFLLF